MKQNSRPSRPYRIGSANPKPARRVRAQVLVRKCDLNINQVFTVLAGLRVRDFHHLDGARSTTVIGLKEMYEIAGQFGVNVWKKTDTLGEHYVLQMCGLSFKYEVHSFFHDCGAKRPSKLDDQVFLVCSTQKPLGHAKSFWYMIQTDAATTFREALSTNAQHFPQNSDFRAMGWTTGWEPMKRFEYEEIQSLPPNLFRGEFELDLSSLSLS